MRQSCFDIMGDPAEAKCRQQRHLSHGRCPTQLAAESTFAVAEPVPVMMAHEHAVAVCRPGARMPEKEVISQPAGTIPSNLPL